MESKGAYLPRVISGMADYDQPPPPEPPMREYDAAPDRERDRDALPAYDRGYQRDTNMEHEAAKIYIGNINYKVRFVFSNLIVPQTTDRDIEREFGRYGHVTDVHLPMDREQQRPRGFAFVTFKDSRDADEALNMDGYVFCFLARLALQA